MYLYWVSLGALRACVPASRAGACLSRPWGTLLLKRTSFLIVQTHVPAVVTACHGPRLLSGGVLLHLHFTPHRGRLRLPFLMALQTNLLLSIAILDRALRLNTPTHSQNSTQFGNRLTWTRLRFPATPRLCLGLPPLTSFDRPPRPLLQVDNSRWHPPTFRFLSMGQRTEVLAIQQRH